MDLDSSSCSGDKSEKEESTGCFGVMGIVANCCVVRCIDKRFDADNGKIFTEPIESFSRDVSTRTSPASKGQEREEEILMIDYLSPISTTVKIRLRAHQSVFVDHLGFVLGENGWKIVCKIWHLERTVEIV